MTTAIKCTDYTETPGLGTGMSPNQTLWPTLAVLLKKTTIPSKPKVEYTPTEGKWVKSRKQKTSNAKGGGHCSSQSSWKMSENCTSRANTKANLQLQLTQMKCLTERFPLGKGIGRKINFFKGDCSLSLISKNPQAYDGGTAPKNADFYFEWLTDVFTEDLGQEEYKCNDNGNLMKFSLQLIHTTD